VTANFSYLAQVVWLLAFSLLNFSCVFAFSTLKHFKVFRLSLVDGRHTQERSSSGDGPVTSCGLERIYHLPFVGA